MGPRFRGSGGARCEVVWRYEPVAGRADALTESGHSRARALTEWKRRVVGAWPSVAVGSVDTGPDKVADLRGTRHVKVVVSLGSLSPDDVSVQLLHGPLGPNDELDNVSLIPLGFVGPAADAGPLRSPGAFLFSPP